MKVTNRMMLKNLILILLFNIFYGAHSKAIITIRIFNYKNNDDLKHDGNKCETFHWASDFCDPMFDICVSTKKRCDTLNKKIDHWINKQTLFTVLNQNIELQKIERKFSIYVRIHDHDRFDDHDLIGTFTADFYLENFNQIYRQPMKLNGKKRNIILESSLVIKCAEGYYGSNCEENIDECRNQCIGGDCLFNKEKETFVCKCKQGWSGINCKEFKTNDCKLLNCKLKCSDRENINHCVCVDKPYQMSCQELIQKIYPLEKIITTEIQTPTTKKTIISTNSKISTKVSTSNNIQTEIIRNFKTTDKQNSLKKTSDLPESLKYFEKNKESNHNSVQRNSYGTSHTPSTIIIIGLLLLLCICIISLLIVIKNWQEKNKTNLPHPFPRNRPLPPILFKRSMLPRETFKSHIQDSHYNIQSNMIYETCTIPNTRCSNNSVNVSKSNYKIENTDPYEEPIIDNMESLTCETNFNDSDESDTYEIPIKSNK